MIGLSGQRMTKVLAVVYTALALGANPVAADPALEALKSGDMRKLVVHSTPIAAGDATFTDPEGKTHSLADWQGKVVVLNFWATWCAPCRAEMPSLDALQKDIGPDAAVVTIATGRNLLPAIEKFFTETRVQNLPILLDPKSGLARQMGVVGLPVTVLLDKQGREVARMIGEADWNSPEAKAVLAELASR